jgi:ectoine hydroxylase-related dioxygenase (phytanoyl-CoA dioxygenase family)
MHTSPSIRTTVKPCSTRTLAPTFALLPLPEATFKPYPFSSRHHPRFLSAGVVCIRGLFSPAEIGTLKEAIDYNIAHPGPLAGTASSDTDTGRFFEDFCNWQRIPGYRQVIFDSKLPEVAARLMKSATVRLYHDHLLVKEPRTKQVTPWHQDLPFYNISGTQNVSFWIPVDPVPIESTLRFVQGTARNF